MADKAKAAATEIVLPTRATDDQLRAIGSFDDAIRLAAEIHGDVINAAEEMGTGFTVLDSDDKGILEGVELLFQGWSFNKGTKSEMFVSAEVVTRDGRKFIVNDSSAGIYAQLKDLSARTARFGGLYVPKGLSASVYEVCMECHRPNPISNDECPHCEATGNARGKGTTFYIDLSK